MVWELCDIWEVTGVKLCRTCGLPMSEWYSFSTGGKRERYYKCTQCRDQTRRNKLTDKEIEEKFGNG